MQNRVNYFDSAVIEGDEFFQWFAGGGLFPLGAGSMISIRPGTATTADYNPNFTFSIDQSDDNKHWLKIQTKSDSLKEGDEFFEVYWEFDYGPSGKELFVIKVKIIDAPPPIEVDIPFLDRNSGDFYQRTIAVNYGNHRDVLNALGTQINSIDGSLRSIDARLEAELAKIRDTLGEISKDTLETVVLDTDLIETTIAGALKRSTQTQVDLAKAAIDMAYNGTGVFRSEGYDVVWSALDFGSAALQVISSTGADASILSGLFRAGMNALDIKVSSMRIEKMLEAKALYEFQQTEFQQAVEAIVSNYHGANVMASPSGIPAMATGPLFLERDDSIVAMVSSDLVLVDKPKATILGDEKNAIIEIGINAKSVTMDLAGGLDTVIFLHEMSDVTVVASDGMHSIVKDDQSVMMMNVEVVQFLDGTVRFDIEGNAGQAYRLYQAAFERTPDNEGLKYWIGRLDDGDTTLVAIADSFLNSPEFINTYGTEQTVSNARFVELLYTHTLGRDYDQEGYNYWVGNLDSAATNRRDLLAFFSESNENKAKVAEVIDDGIWLT